MKYAKVFTSAALSATILLSGPNVSMNAYAADSTSAPGGAPASTCASSQPTASLTRIYDGSKIAEYRSQVRQDMSSGAIKLRTAIQGLDFAGTKLYHIVSDGHTFTSATVPVVGVAESPLSGVTLVYDDGMINNYAEVHVSRNTSNHFQITTFSNGQMVKDQDSGIPWVTNKAMLSALHNPDVANGPIVTTGWGEKVACVSATLGVSYWVANLIVSLCGGSCATAETNPGSAAICAACITGIVAVSSGALTAVYKCMGL